MRRKREREGGDVPHRYEHAMVIQLVAALAAEMLKRAGAEIPFETSSIEEAQRWLGEERLAEWQPLAEKAATDVAASFYPPLRQDAYHEDLQLLRQACAITAKRIEDALRKNAPFHRRRFSQGAEEVFYDGVRGLLVMLLKSQGYPLAADVPQDWPECAGRVLRLREWWRVFWRNEVEAVASAAFGFLQEKRLLADCTMDQFKWALEGAGRGREKPQGGQAQEILRRCQAARLAGMVVRGGGSLLFTPPDEEAARAQMNEFDWGGWYHQAVLAAEAAFRDIVPPVGRLNLDAVLRRVMLSGGFLGSGKAPAKPRMPLGVPLVRGRR